MGRVVFLPGAGGEGVFWRPAAARLRGADERVFLDWPGFGTNPPHPAVRGVDGLLRIVLEALDGPAVLVAQRMGGTPAGRAALETPEMVRGVVLTATSGGVDVARLGGADWRDDWRREYPDAPDWLAADRTDLGDRLPEIEVPVLLLWGDADPISPVAVGQYLAERLPSATLEVLPGGDHPFAHDRPEWTAAAIGRFLRGLQRGG